MSKVQIDVNNVSFRYPESDLRVAPPPGFITDISFQVRAGERVLLLGQNGSGKSTLLSLIAGKRKPHVGSLTVLGVDAFDDTSLNSRVALIGPPWPPEAFFANTVEGVTTPCPDTERRNQIASEIHLPLKAYIDRMSSGEKRRVQILFGLLHAVDVMLLDECSTDIDVVERVTVLGRCKRECEERGACCIYATHILDGVGDWATHVALMENGKLVRYMPYADLNGANLISVAHKWMAKVEMMDFAAHTQKQTSADSPAPTSAVVGSNAIVRGTAVSFKHILKGTSFEIARGSRTLMIGCNGSGKSTLLNMIGSKTFFPNSRKELMVCGRPVFEDMSLNKDVVLCGDWWPVVPGGEVHVREMVPIPLTPRAEKLREMLAIQLDWDCRCVSAGELKRIQLFLRLYHEKQLILLDEATSDLDVDQRHMLLRFLFEESVERGVTVVYATHIFEGIGPWATDCIVMDSSTNGVHSTRKAPIVESEIMTILAELKAKEKWETQYPRQ